MAANLLDDFIIVYEKEETLKPLGHTGDAWTESRLLLFWRNNFPEGNGRTDIVLRIRFAENNCGLSRVDSVFLVVGRDAGFFGKIVHTRVNATVQVHTEAVRQDEFAFR